MPRRVAVLDDDEAVRAVVALVLEDDGYEVVQFAHGAAALAALRVAPPDGIILDLRLQPSFSGWDALRQLEQDASLRGVPVLVCSAASEELRDRGPSLLARGYGVLPKPFDIDELLR